MSQSMQISDLPALEVLMLLLGWRGEYGAVDSAG